MQLLLEDGIAQAATPLGILEFQHIAHSFFILSIVTVAQYSVCKSDNSIYSHSHWLTKVVVGSSIF